SDLTCCLGICLCSVRCGCGPCQCCCCVCRKQCGKLEWPYCYGLCCRCCLCGRCGGRKHRGCCQVATSRLSPLHLRQSLPSSDSHPRLANVDRHRPRPVHLR